jgi:two-component system, NarL family, response regulator LiaR
MKTKVLLVEDHQMTLVGLKLVLEQEPDLEVCGDATNGVEALVMAREQQPDVVLMDIGLPEMDGIQATQEIKQACPNTKVIMLTSKDNRNDVMASLGAGADGYCMKGIQLTALVQVIEAVRAGNVWLDKTIARMVLERFQQAPRSQPVGEPVKCPLTEREMDVLRLIVDGLSNPEIADKLFITKATAKAHVHSILQKLCVDDRTQAAVLAMRQGYV